MNVPAHIARRLVKVLSRVDDPEAAQLVEALGPKRRRARVIAFPGKTKADRKAERISRLDAILAEVRARCLKHGGGCEFCGWQHPAEFHHVLSGGQRRYAESVETIAYICADCHRQWHRGTDIVFERAMMWAAFYGYGKTRHAIEYRAAKAAEARRARKAP